MRLRTCGIAAVVLAVAGAGVARAGAPGIIPSANDVRSFLGGQEALIVWLHDDGTDQSVWKISTTSWTPSKVDDGGAVTSTTAGARSPLISPDGTRVVFATASGTMKIVQLSDGALLSVLPVQGWAPHWYIDTADSNEECIVYITKDDWNGTSDGGNTVKRRLSDGLTTTLWAGRAMDAGLTRDGRFLGEAYYYNYTVDFGSGVGVIDNWDWYKIGATNSNEYRTCNGSMSPELGPYWRMMSLTLPHSHFAIYRYDAAKGRFALEVEHLRPDPWGEWDETEWSNHPDFVTAIACNIGGDQYVYLASTVNGGVPAGQLRLTNTDSSFPHMRVTSSQAYLLLQPASLVFWAIEGDDQTQEKKVDVSNTSGAGALGTVAIESTDPAWLTTGTPNGSGDTWDFTVTVDPTGLTAAGGPYTFPVEVSATGSSNAPAGTPRTLSVELKILDPAGDEDGDGQSNEAEEANGTDPLDRFHIASSGGGGGGGCVAGESSSPLALIAVVGALAALALAYRSRAVRKAGVTVAACVLAASLVAGCDDGGGGTSYAMALSIFRFGSTVTLDWTATTADSYNIYRREDDGAWGAPLVNVTSATLTYDDTTVTTGVKYDYYIAAVVGASDGGVSNTVTADYVKITSPDDGTEDWAIGSYHAITWETNLAAGDWVLWVSTDGGATYGDVIYASEASSGWQWRVGYKIDGATTPNTTQFIFGSEPDVRVKVGDYSGAAHLEDESDNDFTVQ